MAQLNSEIRALFINGVAIPVKDGTFKWDLGGDERSSVNGTGRRLGSTSAFVPGSCGFTGVYRKGDNIRVMYDVTDAQIRIITNQGEQWVLDSADAMKPAGYFIRTVIELTAGM